MYFWCDNLGPEFPFLHDSSQNVCNIKTNVSVNVNQNAKDLFYIRFEIQKDW